MVLAPCCHMLLMNATSSSDVYKQWQQVGNRRDLKAWVMTPATVNAYYNPPANEVSLSVHAPPCLLRSFRSCSLREFCGPHSSIKIGLPTSTTGRSAKSRLMN